MQAEQNPPPQGQKAADTDKQYEDKVQQQNCIGKQTIKHDGNVEENSLWNKTLDMSE